MRLELWQCFCCSLKYSLCQVVCKKLFKDEIQKKARTSCKLTVLFPELTVTLFVFVEK